MQIQSNWASWFRGRKFDLELGAIALVYFVQGALGIAHLAVSFFLKDELNLGPAEVSSLVGIAMLPWTVKPLYGLISDGFPIFGYRRRPYLILSSVMGVSAWLCMAFFVSTPLTALIAIALGSLSIAFSDAIIDALVVQRARLESEGDAGSLQSFGWAAMSVGAIASAYLSGSLLEHFGSRFVFEITAVLPLLVGFAAFAIVDIPIGKLLTQSSNESIPGSTQELPDDLAENPSSFAIVSQQLKQLRKAFMSKQIWLPAAFVFLWQATPTADSAFFFFTTNELKFNPEFLGTVRLVTSVAGLFGVWIFQRFLKAVPMRQIFLWTTVISAVLGMTSLLLVTHANRAIGIDDRWFSLGDSLVLTVAGRIAFMPVLVLAARLCPEGIEATLFALLMSVVNVSSLFSYQFGAALTHWLGITDTNFDNLWLLVAIANLSTLLPLPLLSWLPDDSSASAKQLDSSPSIEIVTLEVEKPEVVSSL
ncbi:folate/biopterin family MFS transporter [Tumidithrix helvetica PCC 7403]|uniref:folate/biopterin family MFS transporter n=1 Tax=Tumidithrix helvetica TaxID=3457545 RepID=UPI003CB85B51